MGLLLDIAKIHVPRFMKKRKLEMLFNATADAFLTSAPSIKGLSHDESLILYAQFTREQAEISLQMGDQLRAQSCLLNNAYQIGLQFKNDFKIHSNTEIMQMGSLIYSLLKIDFRGDPEGDIVIRGCFFSKYYSGKVCRLISSLDEGLLTGLCGGGKLNFSQRISEGHECCRAYLTNNRRVS